MGNRTLLLAAPGRLAPACGTGPARDNRRFGAAGGGPGTLSRPNMRRPDKNFKAADFRLFSGL
jgi:hypothetical protein